MPARQKTGLILLLALSLFTLAAAIIKSLSTVAQLPPFVFTDALIWASVEQSLVCIISCIPPLLPLAKTDYPFVVYIRSLFERILSMRSSERNQPLRPPYANSNFEAGIGYQAPGEVKTIGRATVRREPGRDDDDDVSVTGLNEEWTRGKSSHSDPESGLSSTDNSASHS